MVIPDILPSMAGYKHFPNYLRDMIYLTPYTKAVFVGLLLSDASLYKVRAQKKCTRPISTIPGPFSIFAEGIFDSIT